MNRQDYIKHVGNYRLAVEFETQALSAAAEFLPLPARAVRDGGEPTPAYWEWLIEQYVVPEAPRPEGETVDERIARLGLTDIGDRRHEALAIAHLYVDDATFRQLADARLLSKVDEIILPANRLEGLSRGRGWARQGTGSNVVWGRRVSGGYQVGPGRWSVGATDGFSRKRSDDWDVEHVTVGPETWTVAS